MSQFFDKSEVRRTALKCEPIQFEGLYFYPITVEHYDVFLACESALTVRLSMLPAIYAAKNYAQAIFSMQLDAMMQGGNEGQAGYWTRFMQLLVLSLKIEPEAVGRSIQMLVDKNSPTTLKALVITQTTEDEGERLVRISPSQIGQIRELIALMNGRELPDEADNAELIQAEQDVQDLNRAFELDVNMDDLKASIAASQHIRMKELDSWTILEFDLIKNAIDREKHFMVYGIGEASGMVKFKNGNPVPSPFFNKKKENIGIISAQAFQSRVQGAIQQTDSLPNLPI